MHRDVIYLQAVWEYDIDESEQRAAAQRSPPAQHQADLSRREGWLRSACGCDIRISPSDILIIGPSRGLDPRGRGIFSRHRAVTPLPGELAPPQ
jgi:hypothetical protein